MPCTVWWNHLKLKKHQTKRTNENWDHCSAQLRRLSSNLASICSLAPRTLPAELAKDKRPEAKDGATVDATETRSSPKERTGTLWLWAKG